jgi:DNA-binding NarL/FixJ family response regulator
MKAATVLIVDDHSLIREGFRACLDGARDLRVVGDAADGLEAERQAIRLRPDVVLLDISLPLRDGIETARVIRRCLPETRIIMLTAWADPDKLIASVDAGAEGYITKDMPPEKVIAAIRSALAGDPPIAGAVALEALRKLGRPHVCADPSAALSRLTMRQREIAHLLSEGLANKEIARRLGIADQTVANHLKFIFHKLGVHNRAGVAWVYLNGEPGPR